MSLNTDGVFNQINVSKQQSDVQLLAVQITPAHTFIPSQQLS